MATLIQQFYRIMDEDLHIKEAYKQDNQAKSFCLCVNRITTDGEKYEEFEIDTEKIPIETIYKYYTQPIIIYQMCQGKKFNEDLQEFKNRVVFAIRSITEPNNFMFECELYNDSELPYHFEKDDFFIA